MLISMEPTMSNLRSLRDIGLILGGVLAGACLFTFVKPASSETPMGNVIHGVIIMEEDKTSRREQTPDNAEGWGAITRSYEYRRPTIVSSQLYPTHEDCTSVKLDVWLGGGRVTYSLFNGVEPRSPPADHADAPGRSTMLIGGKECQVRVTIERADGRGGN
jgi:hypothetical protein